MATRTTGQVQDVADSALKRRCQIWPPEGHVGRRSAVVAAKVSVYANRVTSPTSAKIRPALTGPMPYRLVSVVPDVVARKLAALAAGTPNAP